MTGDKLRIATRGSMLAIWQAEEVARLLVESHPHLEVELVRLRTQGDIITDVALSQLPGKAFFTKEIEEALLDGRADLAVHSGKDLPTALPPGLELFGCIARHSPLDALIATGGHTLLSLPLQARLGTSSIRRRALVAHLRPDLKVLDLRGNVDTRLKKLTDGQYDAIILAAAGLERLQLTDRITERLSAEQFPPAVSQGAMALEVRSADDELKRLLAPLIDSATTTAVLAERALLRSLEGGCQVPLGALAVVNGGLLQMKGSIVDPQGAIRVDGQIEGAAADAEMLGIELAEQLRLNGGADILRTLRE